MVYVLLVFFGLCFGSFVNALVWRTRQNSQQSKSKSQKLSIWNGRSICPNCRHQLSTWDLIPILSWLWLRGKCRYCKKPISPQYPLVELSVALVFALSYIFWPQDLQGGQIVLFVTWLASSVGLLALLVYDLKWMLLPNTIIYPTFLIALVGNAWFLIGFADNKFYSLTHWVLSVLVASGIFGLLFLVSGGRWIGFGDVRLGLITGTLLQTPSKSLLMIFIASVLGTAVSLPLIAAGKKQLSAKIPYGPFLIASTFICLLFGQSIIDWYKHLFLL